MNLGSAHGRSTLPVELGRLTGLPLRHIDLLRYEFGAMDWPKVRDRSTRLAHDEESRSFEGGHSRPYDERAATAETLIRRGLHLPLRVRPSPPAACPEKLATVSLAWIVASRRPARRRVARLISDHPRLRGHHLRSWAAVRRVPESLS